MRYFLLLIISLLSYNTFGQENNEAYLRKYDIIKDSINELTFKDKINFDNFIETFENNKGFELPKFLIVDNSGMLLKHKLDVWISECGKGDVAELKKKYSKKLPSLEKLNMFFNEKIKMPSKDNFAIVFIWHKATDKYNKHTFETYHTWKENNNIKFYFLNLEMN
ncbi:hypothetical protein VDP25_17145 [Winogradskyella sp. ECml5-4]|uniref:hypothetical protein n=1 Tax=Winogradskyella sp. ECml5-4 TaxID=3110975 RepID=UPI0018626082|nr:hypothetical protein H7F37_01380 [Winogradskyella sp. PAMC22761]